MGEPIYAVALDEVVRFTSELIRIDTTNHGNGDGRLAHGVNERVPVDGLHFGLRVLDDFLRNA